MDANRANRAEQVDTLLHRGVVGVDDALGDWDWEMEADFDMEGVVHHLARHVDHGPVGAPGEAVVHRGDGTLTAKTCTPVGFVSNPDLRGEPGRANRIPRRPSSAHPEAAVKNRGRVKRTARPTTSDCAPGSSNDFAMPDSDLRVLPGPAYATMRRSPCRGSAAAKNRGGKQTPPRSMTFHQNPYRRVAAAAATGAAKNNSYVSMLKESGIRRTAGPTTAMDIAALQVLDLSPDEATCAKKGYVSVLGESGIPKPTLNPWKWTASDFDEEEEEVVCLATHEGWGCKL